jgi:hypothetical protein
MRSWRDQYKKFMLEFIKQGHVPQLLEDGDVDPFGGEYTHHNGPKCTKCGNWYCWHCWESDRENIDLCTK